MRQREQSASMDLREPQITSKLWPFPRSEQVPQISYIFVRVGAKKYLKCLKVPQRNVIGAGWSEGRKESSQRSADQKGQGGGGLLFCKTATIMNDFQITEGFRYSTRFADQEGQGGGGHAAEG